MLSSKDISTFCKNNTPAYEPFYAKVAYAYINSLLNSTDVKALLDKIKSRSSNTKDSLIYQSIYRNALVKFTDSDSRALVAYSFLRKNDELYAMISETFFTGEFRTFIGAGLSTEYVPYTDMAGSAGQGHFTDQNLFTDSENGAQVLVFLNYYSSDSDVASQLGIQTKEQVEAATLKVKSLLAVVMPARVGCYMSMVPVSLMSPPDDISQLEVTSNPWLVPGYHDWLRSLSRTELRLLYTDTSQQGQTDPSIVTPTVGFQIEASWEPGPEDILSMLIRGSGGWGNLIMQIRAEYVNAEGHVQLPGKPATSFLAEDVKFIFKPKEFRPMTNEIAFNKIYIKMR